MREAMQMLSLLPVFILLALYLRIKPRLQQRDFGIDSWYFLLYADELRRTRRLPVKLPYFLLEEEEQWYPPALPILLAIFPQKYLERYHWLISATIDAAQVSLLFLFSYLFTRNTLIPSLAALLYATSPILVTQNSNLNSRSIGALILTLTILSIYMYSATFNLGYLVLAVIFGAMLLYAHRFASQQMVFLLIGFSIFYFNPIYVYISAAIYFVAFISGGYFYINTLRGHIQALLYWRRNLPFLPHQVYCSPIYGNQSKAKEKKGCLGIASSRLWFNLTKLQFLLLILLISYYAFINAEIMDARLRFILCWFFVIVLNITAINYIRPLKFLGEGWRYFMYGVFPASFLLPVLILSGRGSVAFGISIMAVFLIINFMLIGRIYAEQQRNILAAVDNNLREMLTYIKSLPRDNIMCLPANYCAHIAYFCRKKTLWGGHGYDYGKIQLVYPVLTRPVEFFVRSYGISYCLFNSNYVLLEDLRLDIPHKIIMSKGEYFLLEFDKL